MPLLQSRYEAEIRRQRSRRARDVKRQRFWKKGCCVRERRCGKIGWRVHGGEREIRDREIASENPCYVDKDGAYTIRGSGWT